MENNLSTKQDYKLNYSGKGSELFGIIVINWLLTVITLGFYYPWAKAKVLQYVYGSSSLNNDAFSFHGTGKEMFKGFIKAMLIFITLYAILFLFIHLQMPVVGLLVFYVLILAFIPLAIHGSYRYRMSRTSWRGIRFGYRGDRNEFIALFFKNLLFTILTLGIYGAWMTINIRKYVLSNIRFGNIKFKYVGDGGDYFLLNLKGYFLTIFTLGIYSFWWQRDIFEYFVNNLSLENNDQKIKLKSIATGGDFFSLIFVNMLIILFTLGLGYAWAMTRTLEFVANKIQLEGDIDLNTIAQTEENYKDATGEDMSDMLDLVFIF